MSAFTKIATVDVGAGGTANITFSSIPSSYTDLMIILSGKTTSTSNSSFDNIGIRWNSLTDDWEEAGLRGNGTSVNALSETTDTLLKYQYTNGNSGTGKFGVMKFYLTRYAETTFLKTHNTMSVSGVASSSSAQTITVGGNKSETNAINSIVLYGDYGGGVWAQYTTATLYGILNSNE